jgi:protein-disulfide isomerase
MLGLVAVVMMMAAAAWAAGDTSALRPPAGHQMALVAFEDLECPMCAHAEPLLEQAERNYDLPLERHDFLIPSHPWSKEAAIMARYFDAHPAPENSHLGDEFRAYIFANQTSIYKAAHHTALPAFYDPTGALRAKVEGDTQLAKDLGLTHTPTIFVVTNSPKEPFVEVPNETKLFETIEQVKASLPPERAEKKSKSKKN